MRFASRGLMMAMLAGAGMSAMARAAPAPGRVFGAENIERHIDRYGGSAGYTRSRGAQAKRKKRPNRLIISKRVRRKHRRAKCS